VSVRRAERARFDALFEEVLGTLPPALHALIEELPVVLEDHPSRELLQEMGIDPSDTSALCGVHSGIPLTERSVSDGRPPEAVTLFREGILEEAGGWDPWTDDDGTELGGQDRVREEIRVTLLHEIGHHFGLGEDDLERLGYG
jgi:predicted Zn-dependent protease with MMP-like domain